MILIVDDRQENLFSLQKLLQLHNFTVDTAGSGEDALKKILKNNYALIILDVQMPGMDGFEVAEAISGYGKSKDIPIIFLSAVNINKNFITKGYNSGGIDYVTKPFDPDLLLLKVKTFYRLSEQKSELNQMQQVLREEIDIRKQAEKDLSQSIDELRSILESIPQIAFIANASGTIEFVNSYWYRYASGKSLFPETASDGSTISQCLKTAISAGEQLVVEVAIRQLDVIDYRWHRLSMTPVKKDGPIVRWVNIFTDIHDQKMANKLLEQRVAQRTEELFKMNAELESSNHDLQQYASVASHDLKEPLRKIQIYSDRLQRALANANPEANIFMDKIVSSSLRMTVLINDLLNYSRLSGEGFFQVTNVDGIIKDLIADLELLIAEKKASIIYTGIPDMEVVPGQIRQLFQNIVSNSLKFSRKEVTPEIHISAEKIKNKELEGGAASSGNYCRITISDNGIGFNEIYKDKIFTMFQRLHSKEFFEGTGIGLAIVKKIIDKHNGIISVRSKENAGTTFTLVLPVYQTKSFLLPGQAAR